MPSKPEPPDDWPKFCQVGDCTEGIETPEWEAIRGCWGI